MLVYRIHNMYKCPAPFCDITTIKSSFTFNFFNFMEKSREQKSITLELRCPNYLNSPDYNIKAM